MTESLIALVPLAPMLAALMIGFGISIGRLQGEGAESATRWIASAGAGTAGVALCGVTLLRLWRELPPRVVLGTWLASGDLRIPFSFSPDGLGLGFAALVIVLGIPTLRFSVHYMHREAGYHRFFLVLSLFLGAMLLLATAGNAALSFVGWELAGVGSYLLIAYAYDRPAAAGNATRAFVTNRIGDAGLVLGLFLSLAWCGSLEWAELSSAAPRLDTLQASALAGCFLLAAVAKSAQVPLSPWVARALDGPTPSSAIFYGALLIHAGIFLVLRMQPTFQESPGAMLVLAALGLLTALYGFFAGLTQSDVKSSLMFATLGQVGLMFLAAGLGWWRLATAYLFLHAVFRGYQFLTAPSLMHRAFGLPARSVPGFLLRRRGLYVASLQRAWLENLGDSLLVRPVHRLAADLDAFDHRVVDRATGLPAPAVSILSSAANWEERRLAADYGPGPDRREVSGLLGLITHQAASALHWFEKKLVLEGVGSDLWKAGRRFGLHLREVERLLSRPRYLFLLVLATLLSVS